MIFAICLCLFSSSADAATAPVTKPMHKSYEELDLGLSRPIISSSTKIAPRPDPFLGFKPETDPAQASLRVLGWQSKNPHDKPPAFLLNLNQDTIMQETNALKSFRATTSSFQIPPIQLPAFSLK